jgi:hypothetical protein
LALLGSWIGHTKGRVGRMLAYNLQGGIRPQTSSFFIFILTNREGKNIEIDFLND